MLLFSASGFQLHGFAMWSVPVRVGPGFFAGGERRAIAQAFGHDQPLQSREPMLVVMRAVVGLAAISGSL